MSPLRTYRCESCGETYSVYESMSQPRTTRCPIIVRDASEADPGMCGGDLEPQIGHTMRPVVKGGTPTFGKGQA